MAGLRLRSIGPALMSGRVVGFAVHPDDRSHYYVARRLRRRVEDDQRRHHLDAGLRQRGVVLDRLRDARPEEPARRLGRHRREQQPAQRRLRRRRLQVDRRRQDAGRTSASKKSEHIGKIVIDPRDSNVVYVAAQGPLWGPGGDRGLYKTTDGGKTWTKVLDDQREHRRHRRRPRPAQSGRPLAAAYQRRRHVWTLDRRRPGDARSTARPTAARRGRRSTAGLPDGDLGRIGLAIAPVRIRTSSTPSSRRPTGKGGIFRSTDGGVTWEKRNAVRRAGRSTTRSSSSTRRTPTASTSMNVNIQVSDDGGKTLRTLGEQWKHVDNHAIWIDPRDTDHYLRRLRRRPLRDASTAARTGSFMREPAVTQFYDVAVDDARPFYNVYGGTQDNFTLGGPARTTQRRTASRNADWFVTQGGDGFHSQVDPKDPNIVYAESQYGGLVRFDRRTGERVGIQPQPGEGRAAAALELGLAAIISPHSHTRLYFARQQALPQRRPRRHLEGGQPRPDAAARPQQAAGHGQGLGRRTPSPRTSRPRSTATSSRSPSRR